MDILAVGTVALDTIETPFGSVERALGGSAMYITLAARHLTRKVCLVAAVGGDFPDAYVKILESAGIDLSGLEIHEEDRTFAWSGRYHKDLNERDTLFTDLNVLETFKPEIPSSQRTSRIVCLGNLDPSIQIGVLDQMESPDFVILDTMNYWINKTPEMLRVVLGRIDCLTVNDSEARELTGESNLVRAAQKIRDMGPDVLVIKKGEHGAFLFAGESVFILPAFPLEHILDPTGAGDAFMGGFAGFLAQNRSISLDALKKAVVYGSAVASFTVEKFGPDRLLSLDSNEIENRVQMFHDLTSIPQSVVQDL